MLRFLLAAAALLFIGHAANAANFPTINPAQCQIPAACADMNAQVVQPGNGTFCTATGATPQTCNGTRGLVTTGTLTTAAATNAAFVINNSSVTASSLVTCTFNSYSGTLVTNGYPQPLTCVPGAGTITVNITNTHATNALNGTVGISFTVNQN